MLRNQGGSQALDRLHRGTLYGYVSDGWHVAHAPGYGIDPNDPGSFSTDDAAAQACVDWLEANTDGGTVYIPTHRPDQSQTDITTQVATSDSSDVPVGVKILDGPIEEEEEEDEDE